MRTNEKQTVLERDKSCDPLPLLRLRGTEPPARGEQHGEELRPWVRAMAAIRLELLRQECDFRSDQEIRELAEQHIPLLEQFAPEILQECRGIARGADIPLAHVIVINHYSDLRDLRRRRLGGVVADRDGDSGSPRAISNAADPGGCSTVFVPREQGALLGQTWDIHASARDYVVLLHLREQVESVFSNVMNAGPTRRKSSEKAEFIDINEHFEGDFQRSWGKLEVPAKYRRNEDTLWGEKCNNLKTRSEERVVESVLISVAGCVGMTGMNSFGLGVCINKLHSVRGQVGVMWSAIVRRMLRRQSVQQAMDVILSARIGGGRHYAAADARHAAAVEVSADGAACIPTGEGDVFCHTNHCVDEGMRRHHFIPSASSTRRRLQTLRQRLAHAPPRTVSDMSDCLEQVVIVPRPGVHNSATCAALVMDLAARRLHACRGAPGPSAMPMQVRLAESSLSSTTRV